MIGILITARLGSTRLSQKHLIEVNDKTFIEWLVERFKTEFRKELSAGQMKIIIATSTKAENTKFNELFKSNVVEVFHGSDQNIPLRHLECANINQLEYILSVDGDDILCSPAASRLVLEKLKKDAPMVQTIGLPLGMNVMGYSTAFLSESLKNYDSATLETGWGRIFDKNSIEFISLVGPEGGQNLRMTLDYQADASFFKTVISTIGSDILQIKDKDLIELILKNNWGRLNESMNDEYWTNFNAQKAQE